MKIDSPTLFVEINHSNYIFTAGKFDENQNIEVIEKTIVPNNDIIKNKFIDIDHAQDAIKKNVQILEDKLNCIFKEVTVLLDCFDYSSINISGSKKLNGSQVLKENISYILNSLKLAVIENEKEKYILHIFNSKSMLDGTHVANLPIGLFGDFYNHELSFFLIKNNDLKNINQIYNKSNIYIKKILIKDFIEGAEIISQNKNSETFFKIKIYKDNSSIIFFENASFKYIEKFNFGTNIILQDISKVCSIDKKTIESILSDNIFKKNDFKDNEFLEEKYFIKGNYRKIRKKLIIEIVNARIEEIVNIVFKKNINIKSFKKKNDNTMYLTIDDKLIFDNFEKNYKFYFLKDLILKIFFINSLTIKTLIKRASRLSTFGWKTEAIPVVQTKNSLIARIFKSIFG